MQNFNKNSATQTLKQQVTHYILAGSKMDRILGRKIQVTCGVMKGRKIVVALRWTARLECNEAHQNQTSEFSRECKT